MTEIDDIIKAMGDARAFPKWVTDGLAKSPEIKNMEAALLKMSKIQTDANKQQKNTSKTANNLNSNLSWLGETAKKTGHEFEDTFESTKKLSKAQDALRSSLSGVGSALNSHITKSLVKGDLAGAAEDITSGLRGAGKALSGFGGFALTGLGLLSEGLSRTVEIIAKNNASFGKLSESGFRINDAFTGMSKAAISANMGLAEFTELAVKNASILAQWGPESATSLGALTYSIRRNNDFMGRFGLNMDEVNEYMTDYLQIQQRMGFLNKISQKDYLGATQQFIQDATEFSNLIGYSRRDIIESTKKLTEDPSWGFFIRSLGDGGKAISDAYTKTSLAISSIAGPELGGQLGSLMQDMIHYGGAATDENRDFVGYLGSNNTALLGVIQTYSDTIRAGKGASISTEELTKQISQAELQFNNQNASLMATNKTWSQFADSANKSVAYNQNLNDKLKNLGMTYEQYEATLKKNDEQNKTSAGTINAFNEAIESVKLLFETGVVSALDANKESLMKFATVLGKNVIPMIFKFTDYVKGFMSGDTRDEMIQSISDIFRDVFHNIFPSFVNASERSTRGASGAGGPENAGKTQGVAGATASTSANVKDRIIHSMQYLTSKGLSKEDASAMIGNFLQEDSTLNPAQREIGGGPGQGIAQWSSNARIGAYYKQYGHSPSEGSLDEQLEFALQEHMSNKMRGSKTALGNATGLDAKAEAFMRSYENPNAAAANLNNRIARTRMVAGIYDKYQATDTINPTTSAAPADISNNAAGVSTSASPTSTNQAATVDSNSEMLGLMAQSVRHQQTTNEFLRGIHREVQNNGNNFS